MEIKVDFSQFKRFTDKLQKTNEATWDEALRRCGDGITKRCYDLARKNTPVDTGRLKHRWRKTRATREGNEYVAKVYNDLYYAGWIEFGHRQVAGGRFIRFIPGRYMLTNATEQTENEAVEIVDSILGKYLLEVFK